MDYYTEVKAMLFSILEDEEDNDGDDDGHDKPLQLMVVASAAKALGMAWTRNEQVQSEYHRLVLQVVHKNQVQGINISCKPCQGKIRLNL